MINFTIFDLFLPAVSFFLFALGFCQVIFFGNKMVKLVIRKYLLRGVNGKGVLTLFLLLFTLFVVLHYLIFTTYRGLSLMEFVPILSVFSYLKGQCKERKIRKGVDNGFLL